MSHEIVKNYTINDLRYLMRRLRDPQTGCPWDLKQTLQTITSHTIEEVYEPFLIQEGYIQRTARGREATHLAYSHLGRISHKPGGNTLF